jgi:hypothetical protein
MEVQISVAKVNKYATQESGDTVEIVGRPGGGLSLVMADGQSSGRGAKRISNMVVHKIVSLLAEGVRDGAAARAASDYLYNERQGRVSATLNVVFVDIRKGMVMATRNITTPILIAYPGKIDVFDDACLPNGLHHNTRPSIREKPLQNNLIIVAYTNGLTHAGSRYDQPMQVMYVFETLLVQSALASQIIADGLLQHAVNLDHGHPADDIPVAVVLVLPGNDSDNVRRMTARLPIH